MDVLLIAMEFIIIKQKLNVFQPAKVMKNLFNQQQVINVFTIAKQMILHY